MGQGWAVSLKGLDCHAKKLGSHCWVIYCKQGGDTFRCVFYKAQCLCGGDSRSLLQEQVCHARVAGKAAAVRTRRKEPFTEHLNCGLMHWMDVGRKGEGNASWADGKGHHCLMNLL